MLRDEACALLFLLFFICVIPTPPSHLLSGPYATAVVFVAAGVTVFGNVYCCYQLFLPFPSPFPSEVVVQR